MAVSGKKALDMESTISMAVSGKKALDMETTICIGSVEDFEYICERCLSESLLVEAAKYCVECKEYLCKTCIRVHLTTNASKHHKMIENDNLRTDVDAPAGSRVLTEKCPIHFGKCIQYFCPLHEALCCSGCVIMNHRNCKMDYIPEKCNGKEIKKEFEEVMVQLGSKEAEYNDIMKKATKRGSDVETHYENAMKDIAKFQEEIDKRINYLRKDVEAEATAMHSKDKVEVQEVTIKCTKLSADMKEYQSRLNGLNDSKANIKLFIAIKKAKLRLMSEQVIDAERTLKLSETKSSFKSNDDLQSYLMCKNAYGVVNCLDIEKKTLKSFTLKDSFTVDSFPKINGLETAASFTSNKLVVLSDHKHLIIVDLKTELVHETKGLSSKPFDIAILREGQIAVTMPEAKQILILETKKRPATTWEKFAEFFTTGSSLSVAQQIDVKRECKGICHEKADLYVICRKPNCVLIMDTHGSEKSTICLNNETFKNPDFIVKNEISGLIYVSDGKNRCVASLNLQGEVYAVCKIFICPEKIEILDDGSLLVCNYSSHIIHLSEDLKHGIEITDDLKTKDESWSNLQCICYSQEQQEVYVCYFHNSNNSMCVTIFQPNWQYAIQ